MSESDEYGCTVNKIMDIKTAKEVIDCLPEGKTRFRYFKDRYAAMILSQVIDKECRVADLKKSAYTGLLNKEVIKEIVAQSGNGVLNRELFELAWAEPSEPFLLTLDTWGQGDRSWDQASRSGYNLVLQLNFSNKHDRLFQKLVNPEDDHQFRYWDHPTMSKGKRELFRETLAWARIDIDFSTNEALIEELQTDWLRIARCYLKRLERGSTTTLYGINTTPEKLKDYVEQVLKSYGKIWDEAMLTAAIEFIRNELGLSTIYMHTADTGVAVKKIKYGHPPRSLYTSLPRKFCFTQTDQAPEFLYESRAFRKLEKKLGGSQWHKMYLGGNCFHQNHKGEVVC